MGRDKDYLDGQDDQNIRTRVMATDPPSHTPSSVVASILAGCFSGSSTVDTQRGLIQLRHLKLNDSVLTLTPGLGRHYTEFLGWLDRSSSSPTLMLKITTSSSF